MDNFKRISKVQNSDDALRALLAQRRLHSKAKTWISVQLLILVMLPVVAAVCSLWKGCPQGLTALVALFAIILDAGLVDPNVKDLRNRAINIQEQFDSKVFGLAWPGWKLPSMVEVSKYCSEPIERLRELARNQKLFNWYKAPTERLSNSDTVIHCQKQNLIYSEALRTDLRTILLVFLILIFLGELVIGFIFKLPVPEMLALFYAPAAPIVTWLVRELVRVRDYLKRLEQVQGTANQFLRKAGSEKILRNLQDEIIELRKTAPVIWDVHYWFKRDENELVISNLIVKRNRH